MYLFIKSLKRYFIKIPHFVRTQTILKDPNFKSCRLLFLFDRKTFGFTSNTEQKRCEKEEKKDWFCMCHLGNFWFPLEVSFVSFSRQQMSHCIGQECL